MTLEKLEDADLIGLHFDMTLTAAECNIDVNDLPFTISFHNTGESFLISHAIVQQEIDARVEKMLTA